MAVQIVFSEPEKHLKFRARIQAGNAVVSCFAGLGFTPRRRCKIDIPYQLSLKRLTPVPKVSKSRQVALVADEPPRAKAATPFLKWAGGKTQLLHAFESLYPAPESFGRFLEPFLGGGSVFFHVRRTLAPKRALLFDRNPDLITTYNAIKKSPDEVIALLLTLRTKHSEAQYYKVRAQDASTLSPTQQAARFIYLNKTCYNGLYRVNSRNQFNVPMGSYVRPTIVDPENIRAVAKSLAGVHLGTQPFTHVKSVARAGDFVYFDPPYDPVSASASFTSYTAHSFKRDDQIELASTYAQLHERGCLLMLSNSDTTFIRSLYDGFHIHKVPARRSINTRADKRGAVWEVVVTNYPRPKA